jgi:hypothetical protein
MAEIVPDRVSKVYAGGVRSGQPIELAVHTANLQFFDPDSGLAIGHPESSGG